MEGNLFCDVHDLFVFPSSGGGVVAGGTLHYFHASDSTVLMLACFGAFAYEPCLYVGLIF